ncbi:hypothetical protein [Pelagibacterium limicola]|uniref:hypothetical protein n=1 Tax=Pelagibacterium limicola TaxID=2791022 RepID=UPI0018B00E90|nr:hypothetical protein [Pelagibacterium limicola]
MSRTAGITGAGRRRWIVAALIAGGCILFVLANAHLVYVAFASQPACVDHLKPGHEAPGFRAARSSC